MPDETCYGYACQLIPALAQLLLFVIILPLILTYLAGLSPAAAMAFIGSTLIVEYGAAPVGIGLGFPPAFVLAILVSVALGVTLFLFSIIAFFHDQPGRIRSFLLRAEERGKRSDLFARYGVAGLIPCVMVLGFYVCPPVSALFGWRRDASILMIMTGYIIAATATIFLTLGIVSLVFG